MFKQAAFILLAAGTFCVPTTAFAQNGGTQFEISFPPSAHASPITGRAFVMIARNDDTEPRLQIGRFGVPFFGRDIEKLAPGEAMVIDTADLGTPIEHLNDLPAGDYFVQGYQRLLGVQAGRWPRAVDARLPVGGATLEHFAGQLEERSTAGPHRS
jgi:hypothetical protein